MSDRRRQGTPSPALECASIDVHGSERTYWVGLPLQPASPLLLVFHGQGLTVRQMAAWTGLAERGPRAGFATVFPEALGGVWDDAGTGRKDGIDDAAFVTRLIERLVSDGIARQGVTFLAGLSNGAFFAERLARHWLVTVTGLILVAGTAREASRRAAPRPMRPTAVLCIEGSRDPLVPYSGGRAGGLMGRLARRRLRRILVDAGGREAAAVGAVANDWAAANGCPSPPGVEPAPGPPSPLQVERLSWTAPACPPVIVYKIHGGGHGWPGGPQYAPAVLVGRIHRGFDATGTLLEFAGDRVPGRGSTPD